MGFLRVSMLSPGHSRSIEYRGLGTGSLEERNRVACVREQVYWWANESVKVWVCMPACKCMSMSHCAPHMWKSLRHTDMYMCVIWRYVCVWVWASPCVYMHVYRYMCTSVYKYVLFQGSLKTHSWRWFWFDLCKLSIDFRLWYGEEWGGRPEKEGCLCLMSGRLGSMSNGCHCPERHRGDGIRVTGLWLGGDWVLRLASEIGSGLALEMFRGPTLTRESHKYVGPECEVEGSDLLSAPSHPQIWDDVIRLQFLTLGSTHSAQRS